MYIPPENTPETSETVQEATPTFQSALDIVMKDQPAPEKKKRGRKPKVVAPPPPPPPVEAPKTRKRRVAPLNKTERAFSVAIAATEKERSKCIDELSKIMEQWDVKQARLKSLDWKISNLKGTTSTSSIAGMQLQSYAQPPAQYPPNVNYPPPPAYQQATNFVPPSMRTPSLPVVPQASGGAIDTGMEQDIEDPDMFLKGAGGVIGGKGWQ